VVQGLWNRIKWLWDRPTFQRLRFTISMANLSVRLPAIIALVGTQIGLLATQVKHDPLIHHNSSVLCPAATRGSGGHERTFWPNMLSCNLHHYSPRVGHIAPTR